MTLDVIVIGPLPGLALMARKIVTRSRGVAPLKVVVATTSHAVMPPPVRVGAAAADDDWWVSTATVTSALGAGAMEAVVKTLTLFGSWPDVSNVWVIAAETSAAVAGFASIPGSEDVGVRCSTHVTNVTIRATTSIL